MFSDSLIQSGSESVCVSVFCSYICIIMGLRISQQYYIISDIGADITLEHY